MNNQPVISVAMATFNGGKYLKEQLDSIYDQTYKLIEVIVVDDCSTDATLHILNQFSKTHQLKYYVNDINLGFVKSFEKAIEKCKGDYVALSDQDDIWEQDKLKVLLNEIGSNLMIHSDCTIINDQNNILKNSWKEQLGYRIDIKNLFFGNVVTGCTVLFKNDLLKTALPFPDGIAYHDWWLALCAAKENKITYTPKCLTRYRQHNEQHTGIGIDKDYIVRNIFLNIKNRYINNDCQRVVAFKKHRKNLLAIRNTACSVEHKIIFDDALTYIDDYIKNKVHLKTFYVGLKYNSLLYPHKNYLYIKNIILDIIG